MSSEQIKITDRVFAWFMKGMVGICSALIVFIFFDFKEEVKAMRLELKGEIQSIHKEVGEIQGDNSNTKERVARIEGRMTK